VYDAIIQSTTELKELAKWKEKSSLWQIWIILARPIFRPFATHTLGTAELQHCGQVIIIPMKASVLI